MCPEYKTAASKPLFSAEDQLMEQIDLLWVVIASALLFLMQAGFLCLETGMTRSKNNINVAIKNFCDFCVSALAFWLLGFGLMYGLSYQGWIGLDLFALDFAKATPYLAAFFLFQVMLCVTSVTILSGIVAERMKFGAYLFVAVIVSGLIYPIAGHWSWAKRSLGEKGWLAELGFVDFAGSTVVHSVGGWAGLALVLIVGPRLGRFDHGSGAHTITPSNMPTATLGALLLFIGWLGFNGGSTLVLDETVPSILINTVVGGCVGAISAGGLRYAVNQRLDVDQFINGALGGLVPDWPGWWHDRRLLQPDPRNPEDRRCGRSNPCAPGGRDMGHPGDGAVRGPRNPWHRAEPPRTDRCSRSGRACLWHLDLRSGPSRILGW
jgi:ammonium transporter